MQDLLRNDTTAKVVAVSTSGTGISTVVGIIPDLLGCIASAVGIAISLIIWRMQKKKMDLEIKVLEKKLSGD